MAGSIRPRIRLEALARQRSSGTATPILPKPAVDTDVVPDQASLSCDGGHLKPSGGAEAASTLPLYGRFITGMVGVDRVEVSGFPTHE